MGRVNECALRPRPAPGCPGWQNQIDLGTGLPLGGAGVASCGLGERGMRLRGGDSVNGDGGAAALVPRSLGFHGNGRESRTGPRFGFRRHAAGSRRRERWSRAASRSSQSCDGWCRRESGAAWSRGDATDPGSRRGRERVARTGRGPCGGQPSGPIRRGGGGGGRGAMAAPPMDAQTPPGRSQLARRQRNTTDSTSLLRGGRVRTPARTPRALYTTPRSLLPKSVPVLA